MDILQIALMIVIFGVLIGLLNLWHRKQPAAPRGFCPDCGEVRTPDGDQCAECWHREIV